MYDRLNLCAKGWSMLSPFYKLLIFVEMLLQLFRCYNVSVCPLVFCLVRSNNPILVYTLLNWANKNSSIPSSYIVPAPDLFKLKILMLILLKCDHLILFFFLLQTMFSSKFHICCVYYLITMMYLFGSQVSFQISWFTCSCIFMSFGSITFRLRYATEIRITLVKRHNLYQLMPLKGRGGKHRIKLISSKILKTSDPIENSRTDKSIINHSKHSNLVLK